MVGEDADFKLALVEHHRNLVAVDVHHLACFAAVLPLSDSDQVARLEVLGNVRHVDLEEVQLGDVDWLKGDHATFNFNDRASDAGTVALVDADFVTFHVDSLTALHEGLLDDNLHLVVVVVVIVLVLLLHAVLQSRLEVLQLFVRGLDARS